MTGTGAAELALWALVVLPAAVGGGLAVLRPARRVGVPVSLATAAAVLALSAVVALARPQVCVPFMAGSDLALDVDLLSALVVPTVATITLLVLVFAAGDVDDAESRFHGLMLVFAAAVTLTATATTLPAVLLGWEVMGAMSYALIGFRWQDGHRVSAGLTAFLTTRAADLGLYAAAGAALAGGAGLALADLPAASDGWRHVAAAGIVLAALGKAAQLPFSFWLSRAMEGPSPVSALLHSAAMVAMGGYLLLRVQPLLAEVGWAAPATAWAGAATAVLLGAVAIGQRDLKQTLAASTAAQLGFVVMAAGLGTVAGGAAQLVAHAATKALLFLCAGAWLTALGTKSNEGLLGVARRWPVVGVAATVGALSLAGIPPLSLWATKEAVLAAALPGAPALYAAGLVAAVLSSAYAGRIAVDIWRSVPSADRGRVQSRYDEEERGTRRVTAWQVGPLLPLAGGAAVLGVLALQPLGTVLEDSLGGAASGSAALALSAGIAVAVVAGMWRWTLPQPAWAVGWLGLERAAHASLVDPTLRLAGLLARFDDRILDHGVGAVAGSAARAAHVLAGADDEGLDRGVGAVAGSAARAAHVLARVDSRGVDRLVEWVAEAVRWAGRVARLPQTGMLHQYYLQAVAVLATGVLLLVVVR